MVGACMVLFVHVTGAGSWEWREQSRQSKAKAKAKAKAKETLPGHRKGNTLVDKHNAFKIREGDRHRKRQQWIPRPSWVRINK